MKLSMIVFHNGQPLVVITLSNPPPDLESVINKYAKDYDFDRMDLSFTLAECIEDYKNHPIFK